MNQIQWNDMYRKLYDAYDFVGINDEYVRKHLGELLDYMIEYKQQFYTRPS